MEIWRSRVVLSWMMSDAEVRRRTSSNPQVFDQPAMRRSAEPSTGTGPAHVRTCGLGLWRAPDCREVSKSELLGQHRSGAPALRAPCCTWSLFPLDCRSDASFFVLFCLDGYTDSIHKERRIITHRIWNKKEKIQKKTKTPFHHSLQIQKEVTTTARHNRAKKQKR